MSKSYEMYWRCIFTVVHQTENGTTENPDLESTSTTTGIS